MNRIMTFLTGVCATAMLFLAAGCIVAFAVGAAAGVSGAIWYHSELRTSLSGSLQTVREASAETLKKMGNGVSFSGEGGLECTLTSFTGDARKITIELKSLSADVTEIHVRVGFWGDEAFSRSILKDIDGRLGKSAMLAPLAPALEAAS